MERTCINDQGLGMLIAAILGAFHQTAIDVSQGLGIPGPYLLIEPLAYLGQGIKPQLVFDLFGVKEQLYLLEAAICESLGKLLEQFAALA